jgi:hypothetical protein
MSLNKRIIDLTNVFIKISDMKNEIDYTFTILEERITKVKDLYKDFIKNNTDSLFTFGLDSFHFQSKMIDLEYEDMNRLSLAIMNRMYCEYYKLYKLIISYINEAIHDEKLLNLIRVHSKFPIYKDLEPFKKYDFSVIQNLHETIIELMLAINGNIVNLEHELTIHKSKNNIGINIDNFINTFQFNILIIREKLVLFIKYIDFFHNIQIKLLHRFIGKLTLMFKQLNEDIKFEDVLEIHSNQHSILTIPSPKRGNYKEQIEEKNEIKEEVEQFPIHTELDVMPNPLGSPSSSELDVNTFLTHESSIENITLTVDKDSTIIVESLLETMGHIVPIVEDVDHIPYENESTSESVSETVSEFSDIKSISSSSEKPKKERKPRAKKDPVKEKKSKTKLVEVL